MAKKKKDRKRAKEGASRSELLDLLEREFRNSSAAGLMLHQAVADRLGLHITDHKCMGMLCELGPVTAGKLAEFTGLTTGAITSVINRLERHGYARRVRDANDQRVVRVEAIRVKEFAKKMEELLGPLGKRMRELCSTYSQDELRVIQKFLGKAIAISRDETAHLRSRETR